MERAKDLENVGGTELEKEATEDGETWLNIMLVGKTGHGKSSTANKIVDPTGERHPFGKSGDTSSDTKKMLYATTKIDGQYVRVIDTPGSCDTDEKNHDREAAKQLEYIDTALKHCVEGIHLFVFVFKYGNRFTKEESQALETLITEIPKELVFPRCAVVITNGDDFEVENPGVDILDWSKKQKPPMSSLFEQVNYRVLLFENLRGDTSTREQQRRQLMKTTNQVVKETTPFNKVVLMQVTGILRKMWNRIKLFVAGSCSIL